MGRRLAYSFVAFNVLVFLLFMPFIGTWFFIKYIRPSAHRTLSTNTHGFFLNPITSMTTLSLKTTTGQPFDTTLLRGKWVLMYFNNTPCADNQCKKYLDTLLVMQKMFNKNQNMLIRAWLKTSTTGDLTNIKDQQLQIMHIDSVSLSPNRFYVIDPLGNLILSYDNNVLPQTILADLQRLIRVSQMGYKISTNIPNVHNIG